MNPSYTDSGGLSFSTNEILFWTRVICLLLYDKYCQNTDNQSLWNMRRANSVANLVFIVNGTLDEATTFGGDRHTLGLANYCAEQGDNVRIIAPAATQRHYGLSATDIKWFLTDNARLPTVFHPRHIPMTLLRYSSRIARGALAAISRCEVFYSGNILPHDALCGLILKKRGICQKFVCRCDQILHLEPYRQRLHFTLHRWASRVGMTIVLKSADKLIAVNSLIASQWQQAKQRRPSALDITTLSYGLDPVLLSGSTHHKEYDLAFFGRLDYVKGADILPEVLQRICQSRPACRMLVIGDGPLAAKLFVRSEALGLRKNIVWTGQIGSQERFNQLAKANVLVYPTREDAYPMAVAETLALGIPVVAACNPHLRCVYGDALLYAEEDSTEDFAKHVVSLLDSKTFRKEQIGRGIAFAKSMPPAGNYEAFREVLLSR